MMTHLKKSVQLIHSSTPSCCYQSWALNSHWIPNIARAEQILWISWWCNSFFLERSTIRIQSLAISRPIIFFFLLEMKHKYRNYSF